MRVLIVGGLQHDARAGNYVYYRLPLELTRLGSKVYCLIPFYHWKQYPDVDTSPFTFIPFYQLRDHLRECDLVLWLSNPRVWDTEVSNLFESLKGTTLPSFCYFCLDYWEGWSLGSNRNEIFEKESKLVSISNYIFAVSPQLCSYLSMRYGRKVIWLPNASVPFENFVPLRDEKIVLILSSFFPRIRGVDEIYRLAAKHLDWLFVWIGGDWYYHPPSHIPFQHPPNLIFFGEKGNDEVLKWARRSSFAIVPAGRNWFSYFADPTKWYVYHMLQLPIISVNTPHHVRYPQFYPSTVTGWNVVETFRRALKSPPEPSKPQDFHTWRHRAEALMKTILRGEIVYGYADKGKFHFTFM